MAIFVNLSNHPSSRWGSEQLAAARALGTVVDIPFPAIDPAASTQGIDAAATQLLEQILTLDTPVLMVQGEYTFTYRMVRLLEATGIRAVASCSRRITHEQTDETGRVVKTSEFIFEGFRDYYIYKSSETGRINSPGFSSMTPPQVTHICVICGGCTNRPINCNLSLCFL